MIRVLIIDDSAFMRKALSIMVESDPKMQVIGTARDGKEGFELVKKLRPDLVTLDLEMPRTTGLECLDLIMKEEYTTPVLIVSSLTTHGADVTLEALDRGAVDFIPKPQSFVAIDITKIQDQLVAKIKTIVKRSSRLQKWRRRKPSSKTVAVEEKSRVKENTYNLSGEHLSCIGIGISTGGPPVIQHIISSLPENFPAPILIAQHMPKEFTKSFANRVDKNSKLNVKEAFNGETVRRGNVYIAQGGKHLLAVRKGVQVITELTENPKELLYHPSVDIFFSSISKVYSSNALGLILTGMGKDGVLGLKELKARKGKIIAQNEKSCVVYGMPKAAVDAGIADAVLSIEGVTASLLSLTK